MSPAAAPLHPRAVIRKAVAALLAGKTVAGPRVFTSRVKPFSSRHLPAIGVYTTDEDADPGDTSPRRYTRTPDVVVQCLFEVDEALDDAMDAMALQLEAVLLPDPTWGGVAEDSVLVKSTMLFAEFGRAEYGCLELTFRAEYDSRPGLLNEASLNDFATAEVTYDLAKADGTPDAMDRISLPTATTPTP